MYSDDDREVDMVELGTKIIGDFGGYSELYIGCLLYTSPSPRDLSTSRMPSSA